MYNVSTGKCAKDGVARANASVKCMEFNPSGTLLWTGDEKVSQPEKEKTLV